MRESQRGCRGQARYTTPRVPSHQRGRTYGVLRTCRGSVRWIQPKPGNSPAVLLAGFRPRIPFRTSFVSCFPISAHPHRHHSCARMHEPGKRYSSRRRAVRITCIHLTSSPKWSCLVLACKSARPAAVSSSESVLVHTRLCSVPPGVITSNERRGTRTGSVLHTVLPRSGSLTEVASFTGACVSSLPIPELPIPVHVCITYTHACILVHTIWCSSLWNELNSSIPGLEPTSRQVRSR